MPKNKELYLTESEIYAIEHLTEANLTDFLLTIPPEKRDMVLHIFAKDKGVRTLFVLWNEEKRGKERLRRILEEHGISHEVKYE